VEYVGIRRVDELELSACDFLKIDTEGFEEAVLAGARQTLAAFKPTVYFEDNQHGAAGSRCPDAALPLASGALPAMILHFRRARVRARAHTHTRAPHTHMCVPI